ncbi:hypothetical protein GCM10023205_59600 [Yinghuangia aomiensis]|uniref:Polysaccharide deacetylase n=1 Tax=Yinghuangia aomiensis TaxID=676205 RepID=A0ABP9HYC4_9ACTN
MRSARGAALLVAVAVLAVLGFVFLAKDNDGGKSPAGKSGDPNVQAAPKPGAPAAVTLIGDGSTSVTGPQPHQPPVEKLAPGQTPPQFVVFSWDGVGEDNQKLFSHFRQVAAESNAKMTLFLSGIYVLPGSQRALYHAPNKAVGQTDISFLDANEVHDTIQQLGLAWKEGHEVGTHFNGHFCGPTGGGSWSPADWVSETQQAVKFVQTWKTTTGITDLPPLPFDYKKELVGGRAPCLEGQKALLQAAPQLGFRYDSSSPGGRQVWPVKANGIWDFPLQSIPLPGHSFEVLSMDYNIMFNQSRTVKGDPAKFPEWQEQAFQSYMAGFNRAYSTNRAPFVIGNHFEGWNGGIYMKAVERTMRTVCGKEGVRCVSFRELADWMDAQDPAVLAKLQKLNLAEKPNWATYIPPAAPAAPGAPGGAPASPPPVQAGLPPAVKPTR